jgi:hypothetical protein
MTWASATVFRTVVALYHAMRERSFDIAIVEVAGVNPLRRPAVGRACQ